MEQKKPNKPDRQKKAERAARAFHAPDTTRQDPSGSYSGYPQKQGEKPEQDADDL